MPRYPHGKFVRLVSAVADENHGDLLTVPQPRHPKEWRPAFLAMQLGLSLAA